MGRTFDLLPEGTAKTVNFFRRQQQERIEKLIVSHAMLKRPYGFYIDEVRLDMWPNLVKNPNLVGIAVKHLLRKKQLVQTGAFRKSQSKAARGRAIFELKYNDTGDYSS